MPKEILLFCINFEFDPDNPRDYWQEFEDDFDDKVPTEETQDAYTSWTNEN